MVDRNYGIDLYKIILTFLICILHVLGQGGILNACANNTLHFSLLYLLETIAFCAVDGYALISGFNSRKRTINYSKLIFLWFQAFFYSFIFSIVLSLIGFQNGINLASTVKSALPITFKAFWYFSAYVPLAIFEPFITRSLDNVSDGMLKKLFILIIAIFTFFGSINDCFNTFNGYSFLWLFLLFILGYIIKRLNMFSIWSSRKLIAMSILMVLFSWIFFLVTKSKILINYVSPTILFNAIFLLILFSRVNIHTKLISFFTPLTFGIYLCQCNCIIWNMLKNLFVFASEYNIFLIILLVFAFSILLFIGCAIIDYIRLLIFKLLNISSLSKLLNKFILSIIDKIDILIFN